MTVTSLPLDDDAAAPALAGRRDNPAILAAAEGIRRVWTVGSLDLVLPSGAVAHCPGKTPGVDARFEMRSARTLSRILTRGDVGFADGYVAGDWDTPDLAQTLTAFSANFDALEGEMKGNPLLRLAQAITHAVNRNTRSGSRRNIAAHYDLGEDFYRLWLDADLNYSSALAFTPGESLEAAQREKHAALAAAINLRAGQSLLEIGCGWGGFALYAAREHGAKVTAVTISEAQHAHAARRVQEAGLSERIDVRLCDYRDVEGRFDRVASIEMFEAVGERYWPAFFDVVRERLIAGGRAGLQIITIADELFEGYKRRPDFIQLRVFPGGMLPSERRLREETSRAGLSWTGIERYARGYADTLKEWGRRYRARAADVAALGFDARFDRLWRYYLAYCEAGFRTGRIDVVQMGLARS